MNGVRRLFNGGGPVAQENSPTEPLSPSSPRSGVAPLTLPHKGPSWPPTADPAPLSPPAEAARTTTAGLFLRKDKQRPIPPAPSTDEGHTTPLSPPRISNGQRKGTPLRSDTSSPTLRRKPGLPDFNSSKTSRDDLLITLLSSEALVESREYEVLTAEEVEELKKEQGDLANKLAALSKKFQLESKIRDAAVSLSKANASYKQMSKQTTQQLEVAERKVDLSQKELWRVTELANAVDRRLLQHRAAVLGISLRSTESKISSTPMSGPQSSLGRSLSPPSALLAVSPATARFDGAHFFAGHESAVSPSMARPPPSALDIAELEEKLKAATVALGAASKKQVELTRELTMLRLEKEEVQTTMEFDLQGAEDQIGSLQAEVDTLKAANAQRGEVDSAEQEALRKDLSDKLSAKEEEIKRLQHRVEDAQAASASTGEAAAELVRLQQEQARELEEWNTERQQMKNDLEMEKLSANRLKSNLEIEHASHTKALQLELAEARNLQQAASNHASDQLEQATSATRMLLQTHGVAMVSNDVSILGLISSLGSHLDLMKQKIDAHIRDTETWETARRKLQDDIQLGLDKRQELVREIEEARREREDARREVRGLEQRMKERPLSPTSTLRSEDPAEYSQDVSKVIAALEPIWAILPSPEARAGKIAKNPGRTDSIGSNSSITSGSKGANSLSEMDVRSLKSLYDPNNGGLRSPVTSGPFSIQAFVSRVQALIADDRALIERLIRFAQAHDLLKKNAERAQKLAQESNGALETYSKQVKTLEDRNMSMTEKIAMMEEDAMHLQKDVERLTSAKQDLEASAAEQAETCRQLQDSNDMLSARTLTLAEEAVSAADNVRKQMEGQLEKSQKALDEAQEQVANLSTRNFTMMERQAELEEQLQKRK